MVSQIPQKAGDLPEMPQPLLGQTETEGYEMTGKNKKPPCIDGTSSHIWRKSREPKVFEDCQGNKSSISYHHCANVSADSGRMCHFARMTLTEPAGKRKRVAYFDFSKLIDDGKPLLLGADSITAGGGDFTSPISGYGNRKPRGK